MTFLLNISTRKIKKIISIICISICMFLLIGCQSSKANEEKASTNNTSISNMSSGYIASGGDALYIFNFYQIVYYDIDSQTVIPLCNDASCDHTSITCNAFINPIGGILYDESGIYWIGFDTNNNYGINKSALDGSGTTSIYTLYGTSVGTAGSSFIGSASIIYDGYIYFCTNHLSDDGETIIRLMRYNINDDKDAEQLWEKEDNIYINNIDCSGDNLVFVWKNVEDSLINGLELYDLKENSAKQIATDIKCYTGITDDALYYLSADQDFGIHKYDLTNGTSQLILSLDASDIVPTTGFDGDYFYLDYARNYVFSEEIDSLKDGIEIYNLEGTYIDTMPLDDVLESSHYLMGIDENYIYLGIPGLFPIYFYEKSQIESGKWSATEIMLEQ